MVKREDMPLNGLRGLEGRNGGGESSVSSAKYFEYFVQCKSTQLHIQRVQFREEQEDMREYRANTGE